MAGRSLSTPHLAQIEYQFELDVHIKKRRQKPLFQAFGKSIYEVEWIERNDSPIVLLKIDGAKASREASFYVALSCHPHIVYTFGLVKSHPGSVMLLQECAPCGDLSDRLVEGDFKPTEEVLCEIFRQICDALICLADNGVVHGDLACRNVLVFKSNPTNPKENLVKLTDFGLTRASTLYSVVDSSARTTMTIIPLRYAAPELLQNETNLNYSEKSDVYSMGVLMWEACSYGDLPYSTLDTDRDVRREKLNNERLSRPTLCGDQLWTIINECWHQKPEDRPGFRLLNQYFKSTLLDLNKQKNVSERIRCEHCQKHYSQNKYRSHQLKCPRDRSNNTSINRSIHFKTSPERRNEQIHFVNTDPRHERINESIPCEFCNKLYSRNEIFLHQINCLKANDDTIHLLPNDNDRSLRKRFRLPCCCC